MKELMRSPNLFELRMIQQKLEEEHNINSIMLDEHSGALMQGIGGIMPRLMVLDEDFERAFKLTKEVLS